MPIPEGDRERDAAELADLVTARVMAQVRPLMERGERTDEEEREALKDALWTRRMRRRCDRWEALAWDGIARPALAAAVVGLIGFIAHSAWKALAGGPP